MTWDSKTELVLEHCLNTFGVGETGSFKYIPKSGVAFDCRGIFDNEYRAVDPDTQVVVSSLVPNLGIKLSDLPQAPQNGDMVLVQDQKYRITEVQKDVHGGARLFLHKV
jgi:hypothetical protein